MKRDGFTIIEVMIFLAISGLLLAMAMIGSGNLARQTRFSDSVNSFHSTLQREYEEIVSGVNTRSSSAAGCTGSAQQTGTDECLLLGKVISFDYDGGTSAHVRYITDEPPYGNTGTIFDQIAAAKPQVGSTNVRSYELSWGASFQTASRLTGVSPTDLAILVKPGSSYALINNIAFLRSPSSSQIVTYYFYADNTNDPDDIEDNLREAVADPTRTTSTQANICIHNTQDWPGGSSPVAAIKLGVGQGSVAIDTNYEPTRNTVTTAECN
jgi:prepilin-type N-terminal cleavage/methylation domain-containing protein